MSEKIKVLNISGWGRSGSTILGTVIGGVEGFFFGGEIRNLWNRVLIENRICGSGMPIKESELWGKIFYDAFGGFDKVDPKLMRSLMLKHTRNRHIPLMMLPGSKNIFSENLKEYILNLNKLFKSIKNMTGCRVIVDSSKSAAYSYVLSLIEDIDLYTIHLVRDPRGVNYSHQKLKVHTEPTDDSNIIYMKQFNPVSGSIVWDIRNIASEILFKKNKDKYMMLRYEDFANKPREAVLNILGFVNESNLKTPFVSENEVKLGVNHAVWGNPSRFKTGIVELKLDEEWKTKMKYFDKFISTVLTFPLLKKYGY